MRVKDLIIELLDYDPSDKVWISVPMGEECEIVAVETGGNSEPVIYARG